MATAPAPVGRGVVTWVVPDQHLFAAAMEMAQKLAAKPSGALWASKRLLKHGFIEQVKAAIKLDMREFSERVRSAEAKEALSAFLEKRPPNFTKTATLVAAE
jgi:enoyl-CoA hydratase/carnithine racemase